MHDRRPKGSTASPKPPCRGVCSRLAGAEYAVAAIGPGTVLISGQLQVSGWRLPVSVPFANFSSQDRHKTQGTPAAVHSNPVSSTSLDHARGRQPASVWLWFGASVQEILTHGAEKPAGSLCFCSTYVLVSVQRCCEMWVVCYSKNDATCCVRQPHSRKNPSERWLKEYCSASPLPDLQWYVTLWLKFDLYDSMNHSLLFANEIVFEVRDAVLSKFPKIACFLVEFLIILMFCSYRKTHRGLYGDQLTA